ncbi:MAG: endonuclease/exonuclease/phosphatase family protein [Desulfobacterales bacterium]|nr:endonuclease/exonuclease/phosphatase family protein [Desulfobacterales bacterium]
MKVTVGTFNLNNLFSRFNFSGVIEALQSGGPAGGLTIRYEFTDPATYRIRTYLGKLVKAKDPQETEVIAQRILAMNVDVLAVQEVENIDILKEFNRTSLKGRYPYQILIEGNDARFIDIGLLSRLPVGAVTSFQTAVHSQAPAQRAFSRDLVAAEIMNSSGSRVLFTLFNNHLKSHFGDEDADGQGKLDNDNRRRQQAEKLSEIVAQRMRPDSRYIIVGDMNDAPGAAPLQPLLAIEGQALFNALTAPQETRPAKPEADGHNPQSPAWTHRFKKSGQPPEHTLFDQIWLSPALAPTFRAAWIDRRTKHGGDGSDHDPAWVEMEL